MHIGTEVDTEKIIYIHWKKSFKTAFPKRMVWLAILGCQLDYSRTRTQKWRVQLYGMFLLLSLDLKYKDPSTSNLCLGVRNTHLQFRSWSEKTPLIWATPAAGSLYKDIEEGSFCSWPACTHLTCKSTPSLALEPPSSGFQHRLKTSQHTQPCGTGKPLDSGTFCVQPAIVRLAWLQSVNHSNERPFYK